MKKITQDIKLWGFKKGSKLPLLTDDIIIHAENQESIINYYN